MKHCPARSWLTVLVAIATSGCPGQSQTISPPNPPPPTDAAASPASCLPEQHLDLVDYLRHQPFAGREGGPFVTVTRGSPRWMAAYNTALAWASGDCPSFANFADQMGYRAEQITDTVTATRHWVLTERASRWNGLFVLRAPSEVSRARPLTITAPHLGFDFGDDRALVLYRELGALGLLQNTAHRCNLDTCSGCTSFAGYACGGCSRASDSAHSVDHLMFGLYSGLEAMQKVVRFEYHGSSSQSAVAGCTGTVNLSQGSTQQLTPEVDDPLPASRMWRSLDRTLGPKCVCYHQRENGCTLAGTVSVFGRLTNEEPMRFFDPCATASSRTSGRFIHLEGNHVSVETIIGALSEAVPLPIPGAPPTQAATPASRQ